MAVYNTHSIADRRGDDPSVQATSTGTGDTQTITPPAIATAFFVTVETTTARMTFDDSTPGSTNGLIIQTAAQPLYMPFRPKSIKFNSTAAAASVVNILWLE